MGTPTEELFEAIEEHDYDRLCEALPEFRRHNGNIDKYQEYYGATPLMYAAEYNNVQAASLLLNAGAHLEVGKSGSDGGETALAVAAGSRSFEVLTALIQAGANVNSEDKSGGTPLMAAARSTSLPALTALVQAGAHVNHNDKHGRTPLMAAVLAKSLEAAAALIRAGADVNHTNDEGLNALTALASGYGTWNTPIAHLLLAAGANPHQLNNEGRTMLSNIASREGGGDCIRLLLGLGFPVDTRGPSLHGHDGLTPLAEAVASGRRENVAALLEGGANREVLAPIYHERCLWRGQDESDEGTPLLVAISKRMGPVAQTLLDAGASPNSISTSGVTPLMLAARADDSDMVLALCKKGALVDARAPQSGPSALYLAAENNALRAAEALLQYGATVELGNKGATPLRAAADRGFEKMVTLLLDHGANVNTQDDLNRTPLMSAAKKGRTGLFELLVRRGANQDLEDSAGKRANQYFKQTAPRPTPVAASSRGAKGGGRKSATAVAAVVGRTGSLAGHVRLSLFGLIGLDGLAKLLAFDIEEFLAHKQSRGRVFWGDSGIGKTEVAQRLAGLREGIPKLPLGAGDVLYVSGVDGKLQIRDLVDKIPPLSVLFIDEADKCLDPDAGMVTVAEATQVQHAILSHFQRKPIYWVLLGTFFHSRGAEALNDQRMERMLGRELLHRFDYSDWRFPSWTMETLLQAIHSTSAKRAFSYEDDAALTVADYCLRNGGGVRAFDNVEGSIARQRLGGVSSGSRVTLAEVQAVLRKRGVGAGEG